MSTSSISSNNVRVPAPVRTKPSPGPSPDPVGDILKAAGALVDRVVSGVKAGVAQLSQGRPAPNNQAALANEMLQLKQAERDASKRYDATVRFTDQMQRDILKRLR